MAEPGLEGAEHAPDELAQLFQGVGVGRARRDHARGQVAVPGEVLGRAVDHDVGAEVEWSLEERGAEGVVHDQGRPCGAGYLRDRRYVGDAQQRVGDGLDDDGAGPELGDLLLHRPEVVGVHETRLRRRSRRRPVPAASPSSRRVAPPRGPWPRSSAPPRRTPRAWRPSPSRRRRPGSLLPLPAPPARRAPLRRRGRWGCRSGRSCIPALRRRVCGRWSPRSGGRRWSRRRWASRSGRRSRLCLPPHWPCAPPSARRGSRSVVGDPWSPILTYRDAPLAKAEIYERFTTPGKVHG